MKYVILGASAAGVNAVREIRKLDPRGKIVLISKDKDIYSRCILHHYLGGIRNMEKLNFVEPDFETLYQVEWKKGKACTAVKPEVKTVVLEDGEEIGYDKLLIATGSHTFIPPIENLKEAKNVVGFRNIEDVEEIKEAAKTKSRFVVIGAGLVGMDCVTGLLEVGVKPIIVERESWMLIKQLDEKASKVYQDAFAAKGVEQYYGVGISKAVLDENHQVTSLILSDGREIACDYVIVTAGVRPNVEFLEGSGIETNKFGLLYDDTGRTSEEDIFGAGDVSGLSPIWPVAVKESIIAAGTMTGNEAEMTDFFASKSTMNFLGIPTMSLGVANPVGAHHSVEIQETENSYKKIVHYKGRIEGAILQGDLAYCGILQQLIALRIDISKVKKPLFDIDYSDFFNIDDNFEFYFEEE